MAPLRTGSGPNPLDQCEVHELAFGEVKLQLVQLLAEQGRQGATLAQVAECVGDMRETVAGLKAAADERARQDDRRPASKANVISVLALVVAAAAVVAPYLGR